MTTIAPAQHQRPAAAEPLIALEKVTKTYPGGPHPVPVFRDLDLEVAQGEFVALMGPSGSGKSTLLHLIAGIDRPSSGRVVVAGTNLASLGEDELSRWRGRHLGFVFQLFNLVPVLTALENVELPLRLSRLSRGERRRRAHTALELVGLADRTDHFPRQLSGGQEQRVAIARAIVTDPALVVADEPTGDLDARSADEVLELLSILSGEMGKTIVMVTHDPRAAARAHRRLHFRKGELGAAS